MDWKISYLVPCFVVILLGTLAPIALAQRLDDQGDCLIPLSEPQPRIEACDRALNAGPKESKDRILLLGSRGDAKAMAGLLDEALTDYDAAIKIDQMDAAVFLRHRAILLNLLKRYDAALADLDKFDSLASPGPGPADNIGTREIRVSIFRRKGDFAAALALIERAIAGEPPSSELQLQRGYVYLSAETLDLAERDFAFAMTNFPKPIAAWAGMGQLHVIKGNPTQALSNLYTALNSPTDSFLIVWALIAHRRAKSSTKQELLDEIAAADRKEWPVAAMLLMIDRASPEDVLAAARHRHPIVQADQLCQAYFALGAWHDAHARKEQAIASLRRAASDCSSDAIERVAARADLRRLGEAVK